jgi:hypothetical protein
MASTSEGAAKLLDLEGRPIAPGSPYVAQQRQANGDIIAYRRTQQDIEVLVGRLREAGVVETRFLDAAAWMNGSCSMSNGQCGGDCPSGQFCKKVFTTGGFETCVCSNS